MFLEQLPTDHRNHTYLVALHDEQDQRRLTMELADEQNRSITLVFTHAEVMTCPALFLKRTRYLHNDRLITFWEEPRPSYVLIGFETGSTLIIKAQILEVHTC